jgi:hypothetical protein
MHSEIYVMMPLPIVPNCAFTHSAVGFGTGFRISRCVDIIHQEGRGRGNDHQHKWEGEQNTARKYYFLNNFFHNTRLHFPLQINCNG